MLRWLALAGLMLALFASGAVQARECSDFRGAGIVPYTVDDSGRYLVLLGFSPGRG